MLRDEHEYEMMACVLNTYFPPEAPRRLPRDKTGSDVTLRYVDYAKFAGLSFAKGTAKQTYSLEEGDWILKNRNQPCRLDPTHPRLAGYDLFSSEKSGQMFQRG